MKELVILVVEDEVKIRESLVNVLSSRYSKVIGAQNGDEGLKKFKKFKPDLIITDIAMPIMDGLDMAKEIKEIANDVSYCSAQCLFGKRKIVAFY